MIICYNHLAVAGWVRAIVMNYEGIKVEFQSPYGVEEVGIKDLSKIRFNHLAV